MNPLLPVVVILIVAVWIGYAATVKKARRRRRAEAMAKPFPAEWSVILEKNLPPYPHLPDGLKQQLHGYIHLFLDTKRFEGCNGQEITDEVRVTVAAQACMLLLNRDVRCYPRLRTVLVYPHTYVAGGKGTFGGQFENRSARLGESWNSGAVVLAWHSVKGGAVNFEDGLNVTLHEFAHQLDQEDGAGDGAPILSERSAYRSWARVLSSEYKTLQKRARKHKKSLLREYGATNPAEFFAVATEVFFEKPHQMKKKHPELFAELKSFYTVDPEEWSS
jgi:hypothetical protein